MVCNHKYEKHGKCDNHKRYAIQDMLVFGGPRARDIARWRPEPKITPLWSYYYGHACWTPPRVYGHTTTAIHDSEYTPRLQDGGLLKDGEQLVKTTASKEIGNTLIVCNSAEKCWDEVK